MSLSSFFMQLYKRKNIVGVEERERETGNLQGMHQETDMTWDDVVRFSGAEEIDSCIFLLPTLILSWE